MKKYQLTFIIVVVTAIVLVGYLVTASRPSFRRNYNTNNNTINLKLIRPKGGEIWKIGSKQVISLGVSGLKNNYRIGFLLRDSNGGNSGGVLAVIQGNALFNDQYEFVVPNEYIASTDSGYGVYGSKVITRGTYKLEVKIYDGQPCLENCPIAEGVSPSMVKVIAVQKSSGDITIE